MTIPACSRRLCVQNLINKADLILNGDPEKYLKTVTGSHGLED
ncbi:DUF6061 family protein [Faecalibacterium sp. I3-3-89]|nr:DUF6061 family protein [Faecalibacterium sp. I3-3-89]